jgi:hypothetical protein
MFFGSGSHFLRATRYRSNGAPSFQACDFTETVRRRNIRAALSDDRTRDRQNLEPLAISVGRMRLHRTQLSRAGGKSPGFF